MFIKIKLRALCLPRSSCGWYWGDSVVNKWKDAVCVFTDSGGLQEETTGLGIPCFTIRENTERPITVEEGTNTVIGCTGDGIFKAFNSFKNDGKKKGIIPELWDGKSAGRIMDILINKNTQSIQ